MHDIFCTRGRRSSTDSRRCQRPSTCPRPRSGRRSQTQILTPIAECRPWRSWMLGPTDEPWAARSSCAAGRARAAHASTQTRTGRDARKRHRSLTGTTATTRRSITLTRRASSMGMISRTTADECTAHRRASGCGRCSSSAAGRRRGGISARIVSARRSTTARTGSSNLGTQLQAVALMYLYYTCILVPYLSYIPCVYRRRTL